MKLGGPIVVCTVLFLVVFSILAVVYVAKNKAREKPGSGAELMIMGRSEGVELSCFKNSDYKGGSMKNGNPYPVRVRRVWQFLFYGGEATDWVVYMEPGERRELENLREEHGFYIYRAIDGVLIGFSKGVNC